MCFADESIEITKTEMKRIFIVKYMTEKEKRFDRIYRLYANDIYKICLYLVKDEKIAEDIFQQTFFECYKNLEYYESEFGLAHLIRMAQQLAHDIQ